MKPMAGETWEDLGYHSKEKDTSHISKSFKKIPRYQHEPSSTTAAKKSKYLEAILKIAPQSLIEETGRVVSTICGRKFEFFPASNCWYSHAKSRYGYGIDELLALIQEKLK